MRILTQPKVYLIARPQIVEEGFQAFLNDAGLRWPTSLIGVKDAERLTECAGRCCYMSFGNLAVSKTNKAYIDNLIGRKEDGTFRDGPSHGAVTEHPCWTFIVVGAGRGFSHEQVRHRVGWAYSQLSTRYCDFERADVDEGSWDPGFCIPPLAQLSESAVEMFTQHLQQSQKAYSEMVQKVMIDLKENKSFMSEISKMSEREQNKLLRKAARGAARDLLVNATEAIMVMSANARSLWNCIYLRASEQAEAVIREIYVQISRIMEKEFPNLFYGVQYKKCWDGSDYVILPKDKL